MESNGYDRSEKHRKQHDRQGREVEQLAGMARQQNSEEEIAGLADLADHAHIDNFQGMTFAAKEHDLTFSNTNNRDQSNLDQVLISAGVQLSYLGSRPADNMPFKVAERGWIQEPSGQPRNDFINSRSDHCALIFTVA